MQKVTKKVIKNCFTNFCQTTCEPLTKWL